ncbi:LysM peptidoglycan-binding domain-containing protein [Vibrio sp. S17_S38]|uniref:LysM peptidoglycan-binding domain-containing protein n=1 Tax=Vibrio sp. S17_S38 TaxID=2720229 RepID=UPI0016809156|nr:LysM domain-containing protein [Vibrio sp. S17_S38]MBD1573347.1 LysM peptidoglycan-binding domain-containing protein [Vibrio sp. S17_S38]
MKIISKLAFTALSIGILAGCASNDEMTEQQNKNTEQIQALQSQLQQQQDQSDMTAQSVAQLQADQEALKKQSEDAAKVYTVKENDTLWSIAKAHDMSLDDLLQLNENIKNKNKITIGEILNIK